MISGMGLAISVAYVQELADFDEEGAEWARADLEQLSLALATEGIEWREPETTPVPSMRPCVVSFPYSYLHRLRRVLAFVDNGEPVTSSAGSAEPDREDPDRGDLSGSHLRRHADNEGYYIPVDFRHRCPWTPRRWPARAWSAPATGCWPSCVAAHRRSGSNWTNPGH